jgi:uncharacterized metal-binding protein YceD (DUF177 family)
MGVSWAPVVRLGEVARGGVNLTLAPDATARATIARDLDLVALPEFTAQARVAPWHDGVSLSGKFSGVVTQICGVSLEPFDQPIEGEFEVRLVPTGSPNLPGEDGGELTLDLDEADPPEPLDGDQIDVAAYVVEHLALALDPFPRKPGVEFAYEDPGAAQASPFAVLKGLKDRNRN